jgi:hypothetical protein
MGNGMSKSRRTYLAVRDVEHHASQEADRSQGAPIDRDEATIKTPTLWGSYQQGGADRDLDSLGLLSGFGYAFRSAIKQLGWVSMWLYDLCYGQRRRPVAPDIQSSEAEVVCGNHATSLDVFSATNGRSEAFRDLVVVLLIRAAPQPHCVFKLLGVENTPSTFCFVSLKDELDI